MARERRRSNCQDQLVEYDLRALFRPGPRTRAAGGGCPQSRATRFSRRATPLRRAPGCALSSDGGNAVDAALRPPPVPDGLRADRQRRRRRRVHARLARREAARTERLRPLAAAHAGRVGRRVRARARARSRAPCAPGPTSQRASAARARPRARARHRPGRARRRSVRARGPSLAVALEHGRSPLAAAGRRAALHASRPRAHAPAGSPRRGLDASLRGPGRGGDRGGHLAR